MKYLQLATTIMLLIMAFMAFFVNVEIAKITVGFIALVGAGMGIELFAEKYRNIK